jgi:hypothetical protein
MPCQEPGCKVGAGPCLLTREELIADTEIGIRGTCPACNHAAARHSNTAPSPPPVAVGTFRHVEALSHEPLHARTASGFHGVDGFFLHVTSPNPRAHVPRFATLWSPLVASGRLHGVVSCVEFSQSSLLLPLTLSGTDAESFLAPEHIQTFAKALAVKFDPKQKVLACESGMPDMFNEWEPNRKGIFIRECYGKLYDLAREEKKNTFILGNPGVGKSLFRLYVAHRQLNDVKGDLYLVLQKSDAPDKPSCPSLVVRRVGGVVSALIFSDHDDLKRFCKLWVKGPHTLVALVDVSHGNLSAPRLCDRRWFFSSPNPAITDDMEWDKPANPPRRYYMPLWPLEELQRARVALHITTTTETEIEQLFELFGGSARATLEHGNKGHEFLEKALRTVETKGLHAALFDDTGALTSNASHSLFEVEATDDFKAGSRRWVSSYVKARIAAIVMQHHTDEARSILTKTTDNSGYRGQLIEDLMLQQLFLASHASAAAINFSLRQTRLSGGAGVSGLELPVLTAELGRIAPVVVSASGAAEQTYSERRFSPKRLMAEAVVRAVLDVSQRPQHSAVFLHPYEPDMKGIDGVIVVRLDGVGVGVIYVQITCAPTHPMGAGAAKFVGELVQGAASAVPAAMHLRGCLLYAVTDNRYETFGTQQIDGASAAARSVRSLPQFVCCLGRTPKANDHTLAASEDDDVSSGEVSVTTRAKRGTGGAHGGRGKRARR